MLRHAQRVVEPCGRLKITFDVKRAPMAERRSSMRMVYSRQSVE
jgi:hypothetical protein